MSIPRIVSRVVEQVSGIADSLECFRTLITGDMVAWNEHSNAHEGLPSRNKLADVFKESVLPLDVTTDHLLPWLSPKDLCKATELMNSASRDHVSKGLAKRSYSLEAIPGVTVIDSTVWKRCFDPTVLADKEGICFEEDSSEPTLEMIEELERLQTVPVEGNKGWTVLTIPKGLTLNKLIKLVAAPQPEIPPLVVGVTPRFSKEVNRNLPIARTYRVAISNSILEGSRNESYEVQKNVVREASCEMPVVLEVVALCVLKYLNSVVSRSAPVEIYRKGDQPTYTRCQDRLSSVDTGLFPVVRRGISGGRVFFVLLQVGECETASLPERASGVGGVRKF